MLFGLLPLREVKEPEAWVNVLPDEVLETVFRRIALSVSAVDSLESPNPSRIHRALPLTAHADATALSRVCRVWRDPAQRTLQRFVRLGSKRQAILYAAFVGEHPEAATRLHRLDALNEHGVFVVRRLPRATC